MLLRMHLLKGVMQGLHLLRRDTRPPEEGDELFLGDGFHGVESLVRDDAQGAL